MRNNNISNRGCPCVLIRVEDFLLEFKDKTYKDKLANFLLGKVYRAELNDFLISILYDVHLYSDLNIMLIVDEKNKGKLEEKLKGVPYREIIYIKKPTQLSSMLNTRRFLCYVDNDLERVSLINNKRCIDLATFAQLTKGGYNFV